MSRQLEEKSIRELIQKILGPAGYTVPQLEELEECITKICSEAVETHWQRLMNPNNQYKSNN